MGIKPGMKLEPVFKAKRNANILDIRIFPTGINSSSFGDAPGLAGAGNHGGSYYLEEVCMENKVIITAALAGSATFKSNNPATPYSPKEFADEAEKCFKAGASMVVSHGTR